MSISMKIIAIFNLQIANTVFVGKLSEEIPVIRDKNKYVANFMVDNTIYQQNLQITGEMIGGRSPNEYRSIVTKEKLEINAEFINNHDCQLVLIERDCINNSMDLK
jgi:hypothetical protein